MVRVVPQSTFLTLTAVMTGGTQLVEGAHLTSVDTRFCRESSKSQYLAGNEYGRLVEMLCYSSLFTLTQSLLNWRNFVANLALSQLHAFWGHFWLKFDDGGHKNILVDRTGVVPMRGIILQKNQWHPTKVPRARKGSWSCKLEDTWSLLPLLVVVSIKYFGCWWQWLSEGSQLCTYLTYATSSQSWF